MSFKVQVVEESNSQATSYTSCRFHVFNETHCSSLSFCNGCILTFLYSYIYCRNRSFFKSPNAWLIFEVNFSCEAIWSEVYRAKHRGLCWFETRMVFLHKFRPLPLRHFIWRKKVHWHTWHLAWMAYCKTQSGVEWNGFVKHGVDL